MTVTIMLLLAFVMLATSFISGIFGMAGGLILIGILLAIMPLPEAMALHAVTQMASNGWRCLLWVRHVRWIPVGAYIVGCMIALLLWSLTRYVPSTAMAMLLLGLTPFLVRMLPGSLQPNPESLGQGAVYGTICMSLLLLTGVSGPLLDSYFLGGKLDRRQIVATKAICQVFGHGLKLAYFGAIIDQAASVDPVIAGIAIAASMIGTTLARRVLEAMSNRQYRTWTTRLITSISGYYVLYGSYLLAAPPLWVRP